MKSLLSKVAIILRRNKAERSASDTIAKNAMEKISLQRTPTADEVMLEVDNILQGASRMIEARRPPTLH